MKSEIAKLWVEALRSRRYRQGRFTLRDSDNTFCCLGVLCNEHAKAHPKIAATQLNKRIYLGEENYLPKQVMRWAGIRHPDGKIKGVGTTLANFNDASRWGFARIASLIEQNVDRL